MSRSCAAAGPRQAALISPSDGPLRRRSRNAGVDGFRQPVGAGQRVALGTHHPQHQKLPVVTLQAGHQPGPQKRRLSRPRGPQDHQPALGLGFAHAAHRVQGPHDLRVAAKENPRIDRIKRRPPPIGRPIRLVDRPDERVGADARPANPVPQPIQPPGGKAHRVAVTDINPGRRAVAEQITPLPGRGFGAGIRLQPGAEDALVQRFCGAVLGQALHTGFPLFGQQAHHRLAAGVRAPQRLRPPLARSRMPASGSRSRKISLAKRGFCSASHRFNAIASRLLALAWLKKIRDIRHPPTDPPGPDPRPDRSCDHLSNPGPPTPFIPHTADKADPHTRR